MIDKLRELQRSLFQKAHASALAILGYDDKHLDAYARLFEQQLPQRAQQSSLQELVDMIRQARCVMYGDFHTHRQSQRGFLRILRAFTEEQAGEIPVIALEMVNTTDQAAVDRYMSGCISESQFLSEIKYDMEWGFPWLNYKMIFDFAKQHGIPIVAINTPSSEGLTLLERDRAIAACLVQELARDEKIKVFCLIGEHHLSASSLPREYQTQSRAFGIHDRPVRVLANIDRYSLSALDDPGWVAGGPASCEEAKIKATERDPAVRAAPSSEYLKLSNDTFCVLNSPPWMKWQSFINWHDAHECFNDEFPDEGVGGDRGAAIEGIIDVESQFLEILRHLACFVGLKDALDLYRFDVMLTPAGDLPEAIWGLALHRQAERRLIFHRLRADGFFVVSDHRLVIVTDPSLNNLAEAAGQILRSGSAMKLTRANAVASYTCGTVASKILNPRRPRRSVRTLQRFLNKTNYKIMNLNSQSRRLRAESILDLIQQCECGAVTESDIQRLLENDSTDDTARMLGEVLGSAMYDQLLAGACGVTELRDLFQVPWDQTIDLIGILSSRFPRKIAKPA